jgi:translation initiation factor IF-3
MAPSTKNSAMATVAVAAFTILSTSAPSVDAFVPAPALTRTAIPVPNEIQSTTTSLDAIRRGGGRRKNGGLKEKEFVPPMNNEIRHDEIRVNVASKDGKDESLGVMSKQAALAKAQELGDLDLILINANSDPPVCKIVDYSKYRYSQEKKRKEKAKNSKATEIKEVKMSYKIGDHDYGVRLKAATKFIKQGNRVKCTVMFRGREVQHDRLGVDLLERLALDMEDICNMEGKPRREGRNLGAILTPRAEVVKALNDAKRMKEKEKKKAKAESMAKRKEAEEAKKAAVAEVGEEAAAASLGGVLDGIDIDDDDDEFDDDDFDDASLDELLGSSKVADDLFA